MLYTNKIFFLEKATSKDEKLIAHTIRELFDAMVHHKLDQLLSLFSDDANIYSSPVYGFVSKDQYAKHIQIYWTQIIALRYLDLMFSIAGDDATVSGFSCYEYKNGASRTWRREIKLRKNQDKWLIIESGLYPL